MEIVRDLGLAFVEASADTEADPLYCGEEYMRDWELDVAGSEKATGVKVVNLYSGHGTYATLGLGHTDLRVRRRILELWIKPMLGIAARLNAGFGFFCHAFPQSTLQDPGKYLSAVDDLYEQLSCVASFASEQGVIAVSVEQMYSPHQWPWTIAGAKDLIGCVYEKSGVPFYLTLDTGHQTGQGTFLRPDLATIKDWLKGPFGTKIESDVWMGPESVRRFLASKKASRESVPEEEIALLGREMDLYPFLFSRPEDGDTYAWIESLGCYSPIIHLQQVTGSTSAHLPFTDSFNKNGKIKPEEVLRSLMRAYMQPRMPAFPKRVSSIYLTLEIFAGTAEKPEHILNNIRESVIYWRHFIPCDGMRLDELQSART
jgi:hypothetical protein